MKIKTFLIILFALIIVIFTLQNTEVAIVKLWFWEVRSSIALLIIVSIAIGAVFGMLIPPFKKGVFKDNKTEVQETESDSHTEKKNTINSKI